MHIPESYVRLCQRFAARVRGERGSITASTIFTIFATLSALGAVSLVVSTMTAATATTRASEVEATVAVRQADAMADLMRGDDPDPAEEVCLGAACAHLEHTDDDGLVTLTMAGDHELGNGMQQDVTLRGFEANYVAGFDSAGEPVWVDQTGTVPHRFTQIVASGDRATALDLDGYAWSWGANNNAQLGTGDTRDALEPVAVTAPSGSDPIRFSRLLRGTDFGVCGLESADLSPSNEGRLWCWGYNTHGQIGAGAAATGGLATHPATPAGGHRFVHVAMSSNTTCGITTGAKTLCWGQNTGTGAPSASPVEVAGGHDFTDLAMDANTVVAVDRAGKLWSWTLNDLGASGVDNRVVAALTAAVASTGGGSGMSVPMGNPGDGGPTTPIPVASSLVFEKVFVAPEETGTVKSFACALTPAGQAWCWGEGSDGQLGNGRRLDSAVPVQVNQLGSRFVDMALTSRTAAALAASQALYTWGGDAQGQSGNGAAAGGPAPSAIGAHARFLTVDAASGNKDSFCATRNDGALLCWGRNTSGQSSPTNAAAIITAPTAISGIAPAIDYALGDDFVCAIVDVSGEPEGSRTACWGRNVLGQLGRGTTSLAERPGRVGDRAHRYDTFEGFETGGKQ